MEAVSYQSSVPAAHAARSLIGLRLSALGLVPGQDRLLLDLEKHGRIGLSEVAGHLNVRPATISKMTDRLTERGLTTRVLHSNDARRVFIELTAKGREVCRDIRAAHQMTEDELLHELGGEEAVHIAQTLVVLSDALIKQLRQHR